MLPYHFVLLLLWQRCVSATELTCLSKYKCSTKQAIHDSVSVKKKKMLGKSYIKKI